MRTVKEGTLLLPPHAHKYAKRLGGGQAFQGEIQGSPFQDVKGKHGLCSQRYLGSSPGSVFYLLCDVRQVTLLPHHLLENCRPLSSSRCKTYSRSSVSAGSTPMDSSNHRQKIFLGKCYIVMVSVLNM